jgi:anthranilate phosphoribosyltransferase
MSAAEMRRILGSIMQGTTPPEDISQFLKSLAERGETAEEIATAADLLRDQAVKLPLRNSYGLCDTCGTGGDGKGTMNISTLAALVAASAGVRVVKHGNRAASSRCGSADLLEALGVNLQATPEQVGSSVDMYGFGFCFAPMFHPAMKVVAPVRKALGIRTLFNLVGPLANPAPLMYQLLGRKSGSCRRWRMRCAGWGSRGALWCTAPTGWMR